MHSLVCIFALFLPFGVVLPGLLLPAMLRRVLICRRGIICSCGWECIGCRSHISTKIIFFVWIINNNSRIEERKVVVEQMM